MYNYTSTFYLLTHMRSFAIPRLLEKGFLHHAYNSHRWSPLDQLDGGLNLQFLATDLNLCLRSLQ